MHVNPEWLCEVHLLVDVLHEIIVIGGQLETNDFWVLLATKVGCFKRQRLRIG